MDRQRWLLVVLAVILLFSWWLRGASGGDAGPATSVTRSSGRQRGPVVREQPLPEEIALLELGRLEPRSGEYEVGRDPFRFGAVPRPVATPPPVRATPTPTPPHPEPTPAPTPVRPQPPSMDHLRYLGSFGPESGRIAVLKAGEDDIYVKREDETVEDLFVVVHIGYESIDVGWVEFPDEPPQRLPVGG